MAHRIGWFTGALAGLTLLGCAVGPDYERPKVATPTGFRGQTTAASEESIANVPWWEMFKDQQLRDLVKVALAENRDLKIAVERIEEARANNGISKADYYPTVNLKAAAGGLNPSNGSLTHTPEGGGNDPKALYDLGLGFSWELDFFGRVRRANEATRAAMYATEEARRAVAVALVSDVALAYIDLRGLDRRLALTQDALVSRKEHVEFAKARFEGRVSDEVDYRQAEAEMHRVQSSVFDLEKQVSRKENELSFLIGRNPGPILRNRSAEDQPVPPQVPAGLPAQLLERRPDVRKAEMDLWSATARIGEAKAALYPSIKLTGSYGLASTDLTDLVDPASQSWNIFASLLQPIFAGGALTSKVEVRESQQRQAVYVYEKTLLQALREVEDSLVDLSKTVLEREQHRARVVAEKQVLALSELRYKGGVSDYLIVLDSQRSLLDAETEEAVAAVGQARALVQLYKALGGGWPAPKGSGTAPKPGATAPAPAPAPSAAPAPAPAAPAPAPAKPPG